MRAGGCVSVFVERERERDYHNLNWKKRRVRTVVLFGSSSLGVPRVFGYEAANVKSIGEMFNIMQKNGISNENQ